MRRWAFRTICPARPSPPRCVGDDSKGAQRSSCDIFRNFSAAIPSCGALGMRRAHFQHGAHLSTRSGAARPKLPTSPAAFSFCATKPPNPYPSPTSQRDFSSAGSAKNAAAAPLSSDTTASKPDMMRRRVVSLWQRPRCGRSFWCLSSDATASTRQIRCNYRIKSSAPRLRPGRTP